MFYNNKKKQLKKARDIYGDYYDKAKTVLSDVIKYYSNENEFTIAMWGGGLKGIAFLDKIDKNLDYINYIFDIDENKMNSYLPTGHKIVDYKLESYRDIDVVLIMNNKYETEISGMLIEVKANPILINIDSIIYGGLNKEEVLTLYNRRVM